MEEAVLILGRRDVEALLDVDVLIDGLAVAMADVSAGRASVPPRNFATVADRGLLAAMPAYLETRSVLAAKLVCVFPGNALRGIETHQALIGVFEADSGQPVAILDGASITAVRTAAGSALATRLCARQDARVLAILGTGVQARSHARVVPRVRRFAEILVAGRTPEKVEALATEIGATPVRSYAEAVALADVVCACTHATEPIVRREWLRPGTHVNSVGFTAGFEVDPAAFADAVVIVESRDAAIGEYPNGAADLTAAVRQGLARPEDICEIGELVEGRRSGRTDPDQITVYRSVGVAAEDAIAACLVVEAARRRGLGVEVDLS
ncbi:MAG: ornithine cyclodeaminase family protein [Armatimonadota bacterium]|nr:ornithine cyclodeaminase family protein [Armatimonadota bacterium]